MSDTTIWAKPEFLPGLEAAEQTLWRGLQAMSERSLVEYGQSRSNNHNYNQVSLVGDFSRKVVLAIAQFAEEAMWPTRPYRMPRYAYKRSWGPSNPPCLLELYTAFNETLDELCRNFVDHTNRDTAAKQADGYTVPVESDVWSRACEIAIPAEWRDEDAEYAHWKQFSDLLMYGETPEGVTIDLPMPDFTAAQVNTVLWFLEEIMGQVKHDLRLTVCEECHCLCNSNSDPTDSCTGCEKELCADCMGYSGECETCGESTCPDCRPTCPECDESYCPVCKPATCPECQTALPPNTGGGDHA